MNSLFVRWLFAPVTVDGFLWTAIAFFGAMLTALSSDDAYKYIDATILFWMKTTCSVSGASCIAFKSFRSTTYAQHISETKEPEPKKEP